MNNNTTPPKTNNEEETSVIVDSRTGEIIPQGASNISKLPGLTVEVAKVGTLEFTAEEAALLSEPVKSEEIRIRPDGNLYLPWTFYADRLNRAFGVMRWGLIPEGMPLSKPHGTFGDVLIVWGHWLVVRGIPVGFGIGETTYRPNNSMMSYADACEGAKSSSLARNCKIFGASFDLWDSDFCNEWRAKYAEQYIDEKSKKQLWRKKTANTQKSAAPAVPASPKGEPSITPETPAQSLQGINSSEEAAYFKAYETLSPKGAKIGSLTDGQIEMLTASASAEITEEMRQAARTVLDYRIKHATNV